MRALGPDVNLANVPPASIIDTEATRTGLGTAGPPGLAGFVPIVTNAGETTYRLTAAGVRLRSAPSTSAGILVPDLGQLLEVDRVGEELLLELEAENDVEVVCRLVCLDPDQ